MSKEKSSGHPKTKRWTVSHPWLKLIALLLAVMVWFYIKGEIPKAGY